MDFKPQFIDEATYFRYKEKIAKNPKFNIQDKYNHLTPEIRGNYRKFFLQEINNSIDFFKEKKRVIIPLLIFYLSIKIEIIRNFLSKNYLLQLVLLAEIIISFLFVFFLLFWIFDILKLINRQEDIIRDHNIYQKVLKKHIIKSFDYQNFLFIRKEYDDSVIFKIMRDR